MARRRAPRARVTGILLRHRLKSIAFPCISTGVYGYPHAAAAKIAWDTVKSHIRDGKYEGDVVLCCFREEDAEIYRKLMQGDEI